MKKLFRQGDLLLRSIEKLPKGVVKKRVPVVAYGEVTGHSHRFSDHAEVYEAEGKTYIEVLEPTVLHHEEHRGAWIMDADAGYIRQHPDFIIEKGIFEVENEVEYDPFTEELQKVLD